MAKIQNQAHKIKQRDTPRDEVYTPEELAKELIKLIKFTKGDVIVDPARGKGAFLHNFPKETENWGYDITMGTDFLKDKDQYDWIITNPPYSILNEFLEQACKLSNKGFAFLVGTYSITPKRLQMIESYGFKMSKYHMFKVSKWFGMSVFVVFEKSHRLTDEKVLFTYDRKVWK